MRGVICKDGFGQCMLMMLISSFTISMALRQGDRAAHSDVCAHFHSSLLLGVKFPKYHPLHIVSMKNLVSIVNFYFSDV